MATTTFFEEGDWSEFIEQYRILYPSDKVQENTRDDYGLGHGWYFCTGAHVVNDRGKTEWVVVYVKLVPALAERVKNCCCDGDIGSVRLVADINGNNRLLYQDRMMIASGVICKKLTGIPQPIKKIFVRELADEKG